MLINIDFLDRILLKPKALSVFYVQLKNKITTSVLYTNKSATPLDFNKKAYLFDDVPGYIAPTIATNNNIKLIKLNTYKGSMINLSAYESVDHYLKANFSSDRRSKFKTYKKRLDKCFNITYKTYYGNIDKVEYDRLFVCFSEMIKTRFEDLEANHYALDNWSLFEDNCYDLIHAKKATLFVIYDSNKPISISFNPVLGDVAYGYLRSFDIDYSKFYLGFIDTIWELEWCFLNKIAFFDLLKGSYAYKAKFTNTSYFFQKQIAFNPKSLRSSISAVAQAFKVKSFYTLISFLKLLNIDSVYHNFRNKKKAAQINSKKEKSPYSALDNTVAAVSTKNTQEINMNSNEYSFLKKPVYDFLYTSQESINNTTVYKILEEDNAYIVKGLNKNRKIMY
ncbi:GNAT family N-acetyltransferase [Cellulophaga sp. 20_2_10]|uniref:GNAT family N-acetyltransferase n=1 Tax=Cellulophaga sp. 20_2_10 TaxID=2942476 RepID=UPI00201A99AB|nr:GNAT family N-acetyltransferase [Cellulophaga sp. 20_2_10]MCL5244803.1 GNAT family N-acetyltransferase [Cellulophaga sp. 20_2_10]